MATATKQRADGSGSARSKTAWARKAVHLVTCPSGMEVKIRIPNLGLLLEGDALPQTLRNAALQELVDPMSARVARGAPEGNGGAPAVSLDEVRELYDLHKWLVVQTVIEPALALEDLPELPQEDLEMLTQLATRERTTDAAGRSLGTEPLSRWETFRGFHGCAEGCEACKKVVDRFSTTDG
jgi:hypothetical protein